MTLKKQKLELLNETVRLLTPKEFHTNGNRLGDTIPVICPTSTSLSDYPAD